MLLPNLASTKPFRSDSKRLKHSTMDIVVTEAERLQRTSVVTIQTQTVGSAVDAPFFLLCSIRDFAQRRGHYRYMAKVQEQPAETTCSSDFSVTQPKLLRRLTHD